MQFSFFFFSDRQLNSSVNMVLFDLYFKLVDIEHVANLFLTIISYTDFPCFFVVAKKEKKNIL